MNELSTDQKELETLQMKIKTATQQLFYIILDGHDPEDNDTDNRVKRVAANSRRQVCSFLARNHLFPIVHEIVPGKRATNNEDEIDVFLEEDVDSPWPSQVCTGERWTASQEANCWKALFPAERCCHLQNGASHFKQSFEEEKKEEELTVVMPVSYEVGRKVPSASLEEFGILQGHFERLTSVDDQRTSVTIRNEFRHLYENKNTHACGHSKCKNSTGICDSPTFGRGELDFNGYWEFPCSECARQNERLTGEESWPFKETKITEDSSDPKNMKDYEKVFEACQILDSGQEEDSERNLHPEHDMLHLCFDVDSEKLSASQLKRLDDLEVFEHDDHWAMYVST